MCKSQFPVKKQSFLARKSAVQRYKQMGGRLAGKKKSPKETGWETLGRPG